MSTQLHRYAEKISLSLSRWVLQNGLLINLLHLIQDISLENVSSMYELSEAFNAMSLRHTCILFILEQFEKLSARPGYMLNQSSMLNFFFFLFQIYVLPCEIILFTFC